MLAKNHLVSHKKAKVIKLFYSTCILLTDSFLQFFSFKAIHIPPKSRVHLLRKFEYQDSWKRNTCKIVQRWAESSCTVIWKWAPSIKSKFTHVYITTYYFFLVLAYTLLDMSKFDPRLPLRMRWWLPFMQGAWLIQSYSGSMNAVFQPISILIVKKKYDWVSSLTTVSVLSTTGKLICMLQKSNIRKSELTCTGYLFLFPFVGYYVVDQIRSV